MTDKYAQPLIVPMKLKRRRIQEIICRALDGKPGGNRQFVGVLGLDAVASTLPRGKKEF